MKLVFTVDATADFEDILTYSVAQWGVVRGFDYVTEIRDRAFRLTDGLTSGNRADDVRQGLRRLVSGSHVIWFRIELGQVTIIRVLHQSRDAGRWMG